jgi:hypothetical protein
MLSRRVIRQMPISSGSAIHSAAARSAGSTRCSRVRASRRGRPDAGRYSRQATRPALKPATSARVLAWIESMYVAPALPRAPSESA